MEKGYGSWGREYGPEYWPQESGLVRLIKGDKEFLNKAAWLAIKDNPPRDLMVCLTIDAEEADATGGDAGFFFDLVGNPEPFSVVVEDCVSIGRAFGGGVANVLSRPDEPSVFRRSKLWCLDWWGDAAGLYIRAENPEPRDYPDVVIEDCTLVGPDNALQVGNPGFEGYTRVHLKNCRLFSLNFSQPHGQPSTGVIYHTLDGRLLHVELEDCLLSGFKIFGSGGKQYGAGEHPEGGPISYGLKGNVRAYVHYTQTVPEGMERLRFWPVADFEHVLPPECHNPQP